MWAYQLSQSCKPKLYPSKILQSLIIINTEKLVIGNLATYKEVSYSYMRGPQYGHQKYYNPSCRDTQKNTPNVQKSPDGFLCLGD